MKWSWFGRAALALTSAVSLGLGMTACGGGTIAYLWAVGSDAQGNGQVVGYKVDDFTGNLTGVPGQPFSSHDSNPVDIVVRPGGRFIYVINQGTGVTGTSAGTNAGIDEFSVGGEGTLTFQQHYDTTGRGHLWATFDSSGSFLFILDKYSPSYQPDATKANFDANGSITTFSSDGTTGRLNLVQQTASTQPGQPSPTFLEVGQSPRRMASNGSCLFTINDVGQTVSTYSVSTGQLGTVTTGVYPVGSTSMTSISTSQTNSGQYVFITDNNGGTGSGRVYSYTVGSNCALTPFTPGAVTTLAGGALNPTNAFLSNSSKYVYVLGGINNSTATTAQGSTISGYNINSGQLQSVTGSPFPTGAGPQCAVEDPTSKYLYVSNGIDGTIRGYIYSDTNGELADLTRGSNFQTANRTLACIALSNSV
ncbi:MAG: beta-propeller fold lactonase family protein [Rhodospirillales bacterium]|nr:beta-propeller fold lactonase family protein [Acetobacter sp.]